MTDAILVGQPDAAAPSHGVTMREAFWVWLRVAALSFGGPAGQIAVMHRIVIEEKRWVSEIGYLGARAGMPAFFGGNAHGKVKGPDRPSLLGEAIPDHAQPSAGRALRVVALWLTLWLLPVLILAVLAGTGNLFTTIAVFFSKMALVTFGGAYAVLAYVAQQAVGTYHWVSPGEMLDGLGMAETTPGPLIMVLQFVGFIAAFRAPGAIPPLLAGALGGLLATWVTFVPCFLWIFLGGPYIERLRGNQPLSGALSAITAAVVGVILNLAIWFAIHTLFHVIRPLNGFGLHVDAPVLASVNPWSLLLALSAAVAVFRFKVGMIPTLAACCAAGVALQAMGLVAATHI